MVEERNDYISEYLRSAAPVTSKIKAMKTQIILILICCISCISCTPKMIQENTIDIRPEYIRLSCNVDNRHIYVASNPPGIDVSFETGDSWIILPDIKRITPPAYVNITVNPNMTPAWRTGHVRFYSDGFNETVLEVTQMGESVLTTNRIFQNY